jgi:hypothetical protein
VGDPLGPCVAMKVHRGAFHGRGVKRARHDRWGASA